MFSTGLVMKALYEVAGLLNCSLMWRLCSHIETIRPAHVCTFNIFSEGVVPVQFGKYTHSVFCCMLDKKIKYHQRGL